MYNFWLSDVHINYIYYSIEVCPKCRLPPLTCNYPFLRQKFVEQHNNGDKGDLATQTIRA